MKWQGKFATVNINPDNKKLLLFGKQVQERGKSMKNNSFLSKEDIDSQIKMIFVSDRRDWVKNIILIKDNKIINKYSRKK